MSDFLLGFISCLILVLWGLLSQDSNPYKEGYDQAMQDCINDKYAADTLITYKPIEQ